MTGPFPPLHHVRSYDTLLIPLPPTITLSNYRACAAACCNAADCEAFQEHPLRGCFYNDKPLPNQGQLECDEGLEVYYGRRKTRPS